MRLALIVHPPSFPSESMSRFAGMIIRGMAKRGHEAEVWTLRGDLGRLPIRSGFIRKWLGYIDQFLLYPWALKERVNQTRGDWLFIITDQALGMWVPQLAHRPHVIHCHDFLALGSALGKFSENPTSWSGKQYQRLIRKGFSRGRAFISVSGKTREDLHHVLPSVPRISEVVHNGLNYPFRAMGLEDRMNLLNQGTVAVQKDGFIMHIGGNQWYKNRKGALEIYRAYVISTANPLALWMVGSSPSAQLLELAGSIQSPGRVHFISGLTNEQVNAAYSHARVLLFPSLEEGFGWPIVEAMASDCPVITTDRAPMTEVGGNAACFIPRMPGKRTQREAWANSAARTVDRIVRLKPGERASVLAEGRANAARFDTEAALDAYEEVYCRALTA
jgi:glycosyltransferase involved in cell wall biosynthesis